MSKNGPNFWTTFFSEFWTPPLDPDFGPPLGPQAPSPPQQKAAAPGLAGGVPNLGPRLDPGFGSKVPPPKPKGPAPLCFCGYFFELRMPPELRPPIFFLIFLKVSGPQSVRKIISVRKTPRFWVFCDTLVAPLLVRNVLAEKNDHRPNSSENSGIAESLNSETVYCPFAVNFA